MSLVFNSSGGGKPHNICGVAWHKALRNYYLVVAAGSTAGNKLAVVDDDCFSFEAGIFTCLKAGTYRIEFFARGANGVTMEYEIYAGDSRKAHASGVGNSGDRGNVAEFSLAVGNTVYAQTKNSSDGTYTDFGYVILRSV